MRHNEGNEEKTTIGANTKIGVGTAATVFCTLFGALLWGRAQVEELRGAIETQAYEYKQAMGKVWTLEDQMNWASVARRSNPGVAVPDPLDVQRMRRADAGYAHTNRGPLAAIGGQ